MKIYAPNRKFILPYIQREMPDCDISLSSNPADCDVAILNPGDSTEQISPNSTVLFCPNIVGTGMTGLPMDFAQRIARGSFYHLGNNEARLSTIHATDVAKAVRLSAGAPGQFTVTDCADPTYRDFAEALAWRINHKRILTLNSRWVNWIISPSLRRIITTDSVVDGNEFARQFGFEPTPVTQYLRTHVYDDESL